jgi:hypothetical protein
VTFEFGATAGISGYATKAQDNSDNDHQHKDLLCGHALLFSARLNVERSGEYVARTSRVRRALGLFGAAVHQIRVIFAWPERHDG